MSHQLIERQVVYEGRKMKLELHHLEDEETGKRITREVCVHTGAVIVLAFVDDQTIVLIRNKRYAVGEILIELPAGTLEKGEPAMDCAGRELLEEAGYLARRLKLIGSFFTSPGILSEKMHAFAAYDLVKKQTAHEEGEDIEVLTVPFTDAIRMIHDGEIHDGKTIATLLMYERFVLKGNA